MCNLKAWLSTNSGDSYGHKLCSTHSGFVILSQQRWRGYSNAAVRGWMGEWVSGRVGGSVTLYLVDTIATTGFYQSLSIFTCKLWMMRGGTISILGHGIKGQSQLLHSVYNTCGHDTDYRFSPITFRLHMQVVDDERRNHIDFWSRSQRSMSTLTLYV